MRLNNKAQSVRARLLNLSEGDNKRFQQLVLRYFHERFLYRLSNSHYRDNFILKGGALLYAFDEFVPRPTVDMDFMGEHINNDKERILEAVRSICEGCSDEDGIVFLTDTMIAEDITVDKKYPGIRVIMNGCLGTYLQKLTLDVGFGDVIIPSPISIEYPTIFDNMTEANILAYSLETVVAEKFQTMIERGRFNSRMKDYFDLYRILTVHQFEDGVLFEAVKATFNNRATQYVQSHDFFNTDFASDESLNKQWKNFGKKMKLSLPDFNEVVKVIQQKMSPHWYRLNNSLSI